MTNFQWSFLQKFKEDTNVHLARYKLREEENQWVIT